MTKICPRYAYDTPTIFQVNFQYMSKICPRYAQDIPKIGQIQAIDMP